MVKIKKFRLHTWVDLKKQKPLWGIQGHLKTRKWVHAVEKGQLLLFSTKAAALKKLRSLEK